MTPEEYTQKMFKLYYHFNEIEAHLEGLNIIQYLKDQPLTVMLESQRKRATEIRKRFDKVFGNMSEQYAEGFDKFNEMFEKTIKITVVK